METLIHADIFFFISSIALVLVSIGLIIALVYVIKILRNVSDVSDKVKEESGEIIDDLKSLRGSIKQEGFKMRQMSSFFTRLIGRRTKPVRTKKEEKE